MEINISLLDNLLEQAAASPRLRMNYDLRTSPEDGSQRMLNALLPGTVLPIHRHTKNHGGAGAASRQDGGDFL